MMSQVNAGHGQDKQAFLRDVLHAIATTARPDTSIPVLLDSARTMLGAVGAAFAMFEEPELLIVSGIGPDSFLSLEDCRSLTGTPQKRILTKHSLPDGVGLNYAGWVTGQIQISGNMVGLLCLLYDQEIELSTEDNAVFDVLLDSVTVVAMQARAKARHERLGQNQYQFMRVVSHDLRSPLTAIQGFASMLESGAIGEINDQQRHFIGKILSGIDQITSLVDNIQDAGRYDPETGFYEMERAPCDLTEMVPRIVKNHLVPPEKPELVISTFVADDVPIINADINMIERAITNLVDNAIKYTPNGCKVEVGARRDNDSVVVFVKDNGLGISPENQKRLFLRHVRIPRKEHRRIKGTGLGLFIVRSVALRHGGDAWVVSAEGEGSTFNISIPLNEENSVVGSAST
jgi:signal transduction histidine kinase